MSESRRTADFDNPEPVGSAMTSEYQSEEGMKACPWCESDRIGKDGSDIFCMNCEAVGPRISFGQPLSMEERWNSRPTPDAGDEELIAFLREEAAHYDRTIYKETRDKFERAANRLASLAGGR